MFAIDGEFIPPCHEDPEIFFSKRKAHVEKAKRLCAGCRIQLICLEQALDFERLAGEKMHGIHGGLTEAERANTKLTRIA